MNARQHQAVAAYGGTIGRLMAFGLAGHHAGLADGSGHEAGNLPHRLAKAIDPYDDWRDHVDGLPSAEELARRFTPPKPNGIDGAFSASFLVRMLFSCLVDADFRETEAFYARSRGEDPPARGGALETRHRDIVRAHMAGHRRADTPVNRLRSAILDHANAKAALPPGLFTLTVPTGGGKTLTSLSFAMEHALTHGLRRIIYAIPFTSIIDQVAEVFRDQVGLGDAVLEHHSSFDWDQRAPANDRDSEQEGASGLAKLRRDSENWDAPIVVTTAVQFFESLFAARTSKARKLHNLAKSVRDQPGAVHLTTLMCARHRRAVLAKAREDLAAGHAVRLVATSLIEAGVDISFPEVWRAAAGIAGIAQASGRANRNGELGDLGVTLGRAVVFEPAAVEGRKSVPDMIRPFYQAAKNVLRAGEQDVLGLDAVRDYYRWLYWQERYEALDKARLPDGEPLPILPAIRNSARG